MAKVTLETSTTADKLILRLSALNNTPLIKHETVIFIDEIQYAKRNCAIKNNTQQ